MAPSSGAALSVRRGDRGAQVNPWLLLTLPMLGSLVRHVLFALGFGALTYVGFDALLSFATDQIKGNIEGLPSLALNFMGLAKVDLAINIILSAYAVNLAAMVLNRLGRK